MKKFMKKFWNFLKEFWNLLNHPEELSNGAAAVLGTGMTVIITLMYCWAI